MASITTALAAPAEGNDNPTLAYGLSSVTDYSPGYQFLDIMKSMRPWIGHEEGKWGGMTTAELRDGGYLDADGWLREIPENLLKVGTLWEWGKEGDQELRAGTYIVDYEGEGDLRITGGAVRILSEESGKIVFENYLMQDTNNF